ncbi:hypothetical protein ACVBIL_19490 [Shewanella sp. 125m-7]
MSDSISPRNLNFFNFRQANKDSIPFAKGFDESFALAESGAENWIEMSYAPIYDRVHYFENDKGVRLPTDDYYSSDYYTQRVIENIEANREDSKAFSPYKRAGHFS